MVLGRLAAATSPKDMNLPGLRLHALKGKLKGRWSVTIAATGESHSASKVRTRYSWTMRTTIDMTAKALGVSRKTLSAVLNGRAGISPEMAVRLSIAFDTSSESWLNQQVQYDLWRAEKRRKSLRVSRIAA